jgi:hypothetical protein
MNRRVQAVLSPPLRNRIGFALLLGGLFGALVLGMRLTGANHQVGAADMNLPLCGARALLAGAEPYSTCERTMGGRNIP